MTIRVVIADDQALMRAAFRTILEAAQIEVAGEAANGDEAVALVRAERPDVVVMDVRMPGSDGLRATEHVAAVAPATRVLVLTTFDLDDYLFGALRAGAAGFLLKNAAPEELVAAVRRLAAGDAVLDPAVTARVMARVASAAHSPAPGSGERARPAEAALASLTERERDVLGLLAEGMSNAEIAAALRVGDATAKTHVSRVLAKLGVRDRLQAVILAYESGFARNPGSHSPPDQSLSPTTIDRIK
ncbi:MAG TPA: response regulator transcription factor [Streptosporangiaceae bacterium]|nr:response regulator transcription factor [Streptosporangiaceae bacterium]